MKRTCLYTLILLLSALLTVSSLSASGRVEDSDKPVLSVYCYDSFSSEWGPGPAIAEAFKQATGIEVEFSAPGDAVTVLNQLILEKGQTGADVVIGLDDSLLGRTLEAGILEVYNSPLLQRIPPYLVFDGSRHLLPFDYGHFAVCYDSQLIGSPPESLEDLTDPRYRDSLVLMDPRTSTPGLGFLLWTAAVYGDDWPEYWARLRPSILSIADGWSQGYTLFTAGEAPMVLSYGTSPVYHAEYENTYRYKAAEFIEGHPLQIEGMGIVAGTKRRAEAELFIDFMLGEEAQLIVAAANIMLPVNPDVTLPPSFSAAMRPARIISTAGEPGRQFDIDSIIRRWQEVFGS